MIKKSKEELSKIAHKAVETRRIKIAAEQMLRPMLNMIKDGTLFHIDSLELPLAEEFSLNEKDMNERIPSGQKRFRYRMQWAKSFLKTAGLIEILGESNFRISSSGVKFLKKHDNFTTKDFADIPSWKAKYGEKKSILNAQVIPDNSPLHQRFNQELLQKVKDRSPKFFEILVIKLLQKMGYGEGIHTGKPGDGGIDGIMKDDKLGLNEIYVQAKKYDVPIPSAHIQQFIGTIQSSRTKTGVFITSSTVPKQTNDQIKASGLNIAIIDGEKLVELMYEFEIGVKLVRMIPYKTIDEEFFLNDD